MGHEGYPGYLAMRPARSHRDDKTHASRDKTISSPIDTNSTAYTLRYSPLSSRLSRSENELQRELQFRCAFRSVCEMIPALLLYVKLVTLQPPSVFPWGSLTRRNHRKHNGAQARVTGSIS